MVKFNITSEKDGSKFILGIKPNQWQQIGGDVAYSLYGCQIGRYYSERDEFEVYNFIPLESDIETKYENPMLVEFAKYDMDELKSHTLEEFGIEQRNKDEPIKLSLIASLLIQDNSLETNEVVYYDEESENDIFPDFETAKKMIIGDEIALDFNEKEMDGLNRIRANKLIAKIKDFITYNIIYIKFDKELKEYYRYALKFKNNRIVIDWETQKVESSIKKNGYICLIDNQIIANPKNHAEEHLLNEGYKNPEKVKKEEIESKEPEHIIDWNDFISNYFPEFEYDLNQIDPILTDYEANDEPSKNQIGWLEYQTKKKLEDFDSLKNKYSGYKAELDKIGKYKLIRFHIYNNFSKIKKEGNIEKEEISNPFYSDSIKYARFNTEDDFLSILKKHKLTRQYKGKDYDKENVSIYLNPQKNLTLQTNDLVKLTKEYSIRNLNMEGEEKLVSKLKEDLQKMASYFDNDTSDTDIIDREKWIPMEKDKPKKSTVKKTSHEEKTKKQELVFNRFRLTQDQYEIFKKITKLRKDLGESPIGLDMDLEALIKRSKQESKNEQEEEQKLTESLEEWLKKLENKKSKKEETKPSNKSNDQLIKEITEFTQKIAKDFDLGIMDNYNGRDKYVICAEIEEKFNISTHGINPTSKKEVNRKYLIENHPNIELIDFTDKFSNQYTLALVLEKPKQKMGKLCPIWDEKETLEPKYAKKWVNDIKEPELSFKEKDLVKLELKLQGISGEPFELSKEFAFKEIKPRKEINDCFRNIEYTILSPKNATELNLYPLTKETAENIYVVEGSVTKINKAVLTIYVTIKAKKIYLKTESKPKKSTRKKSTSKKISQEKKRKQIIQETKKIEESEQKGSDNLSVILIPNNLVDYQRTLMSASKIPLLSDVNIVEKALAKVKDKQLSEHELNKAVESWIGTYQFTEEELQQQYLELKLNENQITQLTNLGNDLVSITIRNTIKKKNSKPEDINKAVNNIYQLFGKIQMTNNLLIKSPNNKIDEIGKILVKNAEFIENQEYTLLYDKSEKQVIGILLGKKVSQTQFNKALKNWLEKLKDEIVNEKEIQSSCYQMFILTDTKNFQLIGYYDNIDPIVYPKGEEALFKQIGLEMFNKVEQDVCNINLLAYPMNCFILKYKNQPVGNLYLLRDMDDSVLNNLKKSILETKDWSIEEII